MYTDPVEPRFERRRNWTGAATAIVLVTAVAAGAALWSWRAADDARDEAFITPPATIERPAPIPQAGRDLADAIPPATPAPAGGLNPALTTPGGDMALAPAAFDRGPVPEATTPRTAAEEDLALAAERAAPPADVVMIAPPGGNVAEAPVGRPFEFQPLPELNAMPVPAQMADVGALPAAPADAVAAMIGTPTGERAAAPAEVAAVGDIGKTAAGQKLENDGDLHAAIVGGNEATVKGKIGKFDAQGRTLALENGDAYMLAENLKVGEGNLKVENLNAGTEVQLVYRTDADKKIVTSVTVVTVEAMPAAVAR